MRFVLNMMLALMLPQAAIAQALTPMSGEVKTYTQTFALQLKAFNPYGTAQKFSIKVLDENGADAPEIEITAPHMSLPPHETGAFYVWGDAGAHKQITVCVTSQYVFNGVGAQIRGEVCGKYDITRLGR